MSLADATPGASTNAAPASAARAPRRLFEGLTRALLIRPVCYLGLAGLVAGALLPVEGLKLSTCGMLEAFRTPCPGCGLTRSVTCFIQGKFAWSLGFHPLGWGFALAFAFLGVLAPLPGRWREAVISRLSRHDTIVGVVLIGFASAVVLYGVARVVMVNAGVESQQWWRETDRPPWLAPPSPQSSAASVNHPHESGAWPRSSTLMCANTPASDSRRQDPAFMGASHSRDEVGEKRGL